MMATEFIVAGIALALWLATFIPVKRMAPRIAGSGEWAMIGAESFMLAHMMLLVVAICALVDGWLGA
jgi:hypothetical protein